MQSCRHYAVQCWRCCFCGRQTAVMAPEKVSKSRSAAASVKVSTSFNVEGAFPLRCFAVKLVLFVAAEAVATVTHSASVVRAFQ